MSRFAKMGFENETRFCGGAKGCFKNETGPSRVILFFELFKGEYCNGAVFSLYLFGEYCFDAMFSFYLYGEYFGAKKDLAGRRKLLLDISLYNPQHFRRGDNLADGWEMTGIASDEVGFVDREGNFIEDNVLFIGEVPIGRDTVGGDATAYGCEHSINLFGCKTELGAMQHFVVLVQYLLVVDGNDGSVKDMVKQSKAKQLSVRQRCARAGRIPARWCRKRRSIVSLLHLLFACMTCCANLGVNFVKRHF